MLKKIMSLTVTVCFFLTSLGPKPQAHADSLLGLPAPGTMVNLSAAYEPAMIKGLTIHKDNPFLFDFIVDTGNSGLNKDDLKKEGDRLVRYFLACLTIPEKDLWVNLSPYEKDRMIPQALGQTALGHDLLAEDYILKQLTASLIYPEKNLGREFWDRVYTKARQMYGTSQIPVNTFNKVWIMADKATVYEHNQTVFVLDGHLKVMLEEDYLALQKHTVAVNTSHSIASQIVKQIILPELEREVNTGKNFSTLRQIFNSLILASWYKKNLKEALLNQVYADKNTIKGNIANGAKETREEIYEQYIKAYKKGVFNYIKEDTKADGQTIPRKYFSGGFVMSNNFQAAMITTDTPVHEQRIFGFFRGLAASVGLFVLSTAFLYNQAMKAHGDSHWGHFIEKHLPLDLEAMFAANQAMLVQVPVNFKPMAFELNTAQYQEIGGIDGPLNMGVAPLDLKDGRTRNVLRALIKLANLDAQYFKEAKLIFTFNGRNIPDMVIAIFNAEGNLTGSIGLNSSDFILHEYINITANGSRRPMVIYPGSFVELTGIVHDFDRRQKTIDIHHENGITAQVEPTDGFDINEDFVKAFDEKIGHFTATGRPGAGKDTLMDAFIKKMNTLLPADSQIETVVTGDYFRGIDRLVKGIPEKGDEEKYRQYVNLIDPQELRAMTDEGALIEDETVFRIINKIFEQPKIRDAKHIFFNGFPRNMVQWEAIKQGKIFLRGKPLDINFFIDIALPREITFERAAERAAELNFLDLPPRPDDDPKVVEKRQREYDDRTSHMVADMEQQRRGQFRRISSHHEGLFNGESVLKTRKDFIETLTKFLNVSQESASAVSAAMSSVAVRKAKVSDRDPVESAFAEAEFILNQLMYPDLALIPDFERSSVESWKARAEGLLRTTVRAGGAQVLADYIANENINFQDPDTRHEIKDLLFVLRDRVLSVEKRKPVAAFHREMAAIEVVRDLLHQAVDINNKAEREGVVVSAREKLDEINSPPARALGAFLKSHESLAAEWPHIETSLRDIAQNIHGVHRAALRRFRAETKDNNQAMATVYGGIDLNTSNGMKWKDNKDGNGVEMNIDPAMLARIRREGIDSLAPDIFRITQVASIWPLAGLRAPVQEAAVAGI